MTDNKNIEKSNIESGAEEFYIEDDMGEQGEFYINEDAYEEVPEGETVYVEEEIPPQEKYEEISYMAEDYEEEQEVEETEEEYDDDSTSGIFGGLKKMGTVDKIIAITGAAVLIMAIITICIFGATKLSSKQASTFNDLGSEVAAISLIGEGGINAITTAEMNRLGNLYDASDNYDYDESDGETGITTVSVTLTSILKDLKVKFVNKKNKLIANVPFVVEVTDEGGTVSTWTDTDKDGVIYQTDLKGGKYTVKLIPLTGYDTMYDFSTGGQVVSVKNTLEYNKVDVANEVKNEAQVNAAKEDTKKQETTVESKLNDTVGYVISNKVVVTSESGYMELDKASKIIDPVQVIASTDVAMLGYFMKMSGNNPTPTLEATINGGGTIDVNGEITASITDVQNAAGTVTYSWTSSGIVELTDADTDTVGIKGLTAGTTDVTCQISDGTNTITRAVSVTVNTPAPTPGTFNLPGTLALNKNATGNVTVSDPANMGGYIFTWASSNSTVASVTAANNGTETATSATITGGSVGTADITCTASKAGMDNIVKTINVTVSEKSITITPSATVVAPGGTVTLSATKTGFTDAVNWVLNVDNTKATLSATSGDQVTLTAVAGQTGSVEVIVTAKSSVDATIVKTVTITIQGSQHTITNTINPIPIAIKGVYDLKANTTVKNNAGTAVTATLEFKSDNSAVASVDATTGVITGVAVGSTNIEITAKLNGTIIATHKVPVNVAASAMAIKLNYTQKTVFIGGDVIQIVPTVTGHVRDNAVTWTTSDASIATVAADGKITAIKEGTVYITCISKEQPTVQKQVKVIVTIHPKNNTTTKLLDKTGTPVYTYDANTKKYKEATYADFYSGVKLYTPCEIIYKYTGWWTIGGKTYYYDVNGNKVTGEQVILGAKYNFANDGSLVTGTGSFGIDVSKWNGTIDWNSVARSGVSYAIIRCGYRGSTQGSLIEDPKFKSNIKNATAAGIKVGVYFFTQAINEVEAVEEASMVLNLIKDYTVSYPVFLDVEFATDGRANNLNTDQRTAICKAFCQTVTNSGYTAGIYANKTWLTNKINTSSLTSYKIWLAQYASTPTYTATRYDLWQYSDSGKISGISGSVDLNLNYLGY